MRLILDDPKVKAILVNIFGGITRGDEVARGLIEARAVQAARRADGRPDRRHERRGGRPAARGGAVRDGRHARRGGRQGRRGWRRRAARVSILVGATRASWSRASPAARASSTPAHMLDYGTHIVAGVTPGQGRPAAPRRPRPGLRHASPTPSARPAPTPRCIFVPAAGAPDAILEAVGAGIGRSSASPRASRPST